MTSADETQRLTSELSSLLKPEMSAADLEAFVTDNFADVEAYREKADLVLKHGGQYLFIRRVGPKRFRTSEHTTVPTTNVVDSGGGEERDVRGLVEEIAAFATN
jgi:hypothetical protein